MAHGVDLSSEISVSLCTVLRCDQCTLPILTSGHSNAVLSFTTSTLAVSVLRFLRHIQSFHLTK